MSCISAPDPQLERLADAIAQRVGPQRFHVWFNNSTRLDLKQDGLEIAVPNDFISEWIGRNFSQPIQDAANEVLGTPLVVRFSVVPQMFEVSEGERLSSESAAERRGSAAVATVARSATKVANGNGHHKHNGNGSANGAGNGRHVNGNGHVNGHANGNGNGHKVTAGLPASRIDMRVGTSALLQRDQGERAAVPPTYSSASRLRHELATYVVGTGNQLAHTAALAVADAPGTQYNPLFIHGSCGLGKTHLLQGLCRRFIDQHPTKRWMYMTGEEFTNEYVQALRQNKIDTFRRKVRDLDLLVIDDVHFLSGKRATQEEFLHTFNAIEALGKQVVMASDNHPKMIEEFGESLINRFVSGMVVRIDPPNHATRCEILKRLAARAGVILGDEVVIWVARRVTQNVRELEGAVTRICAHVNLTGRSADMALVQEALGDLERQLVQPVKPENILSAVCAYFALDMRDLMSGRRQRTISLARSMAMHLIRKTAKLSFPEIGMRMGKRNHSTVISACRRMERAVEKNERLQWTSAVGEREEEAPELVQRLEELCRSMN